MTCKSCNTALKSSEIIWYPEEKRHEDLCSKCRGLVRSESFEAYGDAVDRMFKSHGEEVSEYMEDNYDV